MTGRGKCYILTAIDYLSRWAEAKAVKHITSKDVAKFVYEKIVVSLGYHWSCFRIKVQASEEN